MKKENFLEPQQADGENQYKMFLVLTYIWLFRDWFQQNIPYFIYFDEAFALCGIFIWFIKVLYTGKIKIPKTNMGKLFLISVSVSISFGLLGNFRFSYQPAMAWLPDVYLSYKFWLVLFMGWILFPKLNFQKYAARLYPHIILIVLFLGALTAVESIKLITGEVQWISLFYGHSNLASVCMVLISYIVIIAEEKPKVKRLLPILLTIMILTFRAKAIGSVFLLVVIYWLTIKRRKKVKIKTLGLLAFFHPNLMPMAMLFGVLFRQNTMRKALY